jgi:hypothetical protein
MSIQPDGEEIRKAVKWISEERQYNPGKTLKQLIEAACLKFDLSPLEAEYLFRSYKEDKG